ncbi:hypothetical protein GQ457_10G008440 [Hibiscus cannabinus]
MFTIDYEAWRTRRGFDNIPLPDQKNVLSFEEHLKVVPTEVEVVRHECEVEKNELKRRIFVGMRKTTEEWERELREQEMEDGRYKKLFLAKEKDFRSLLQDMQRLQQRYNSTWDDLVKSQAENQELKDVVSELEESLQNQYQSASKKLKWNLTFKITRGEVRKREDLMTNVRSQVRKVAEMIVGLADEAEVLKLKVGSTSHYFPPRVTFSASGLQSNIHDPSNIYGATSSNVDVNPAKVPDLDDPKELEKLRLGQPKYSDIDDDKFKYLEERIKGMKGTDAFAGTDMMELSLVPDLILPQNFKVPEFEKFDGTSSPTTHLTMFCRKMTGYGNDDKLLIHCFQDSLTGSTMRWYNQLSRSQVSTWRDLTRAFKEQYKHVMDMVPGRLSLQGIEKKDKESFREYAQRWRNMVAQVQPPLLEKETTTLFIKSLETAHMFYTKVVGSTTRDFADLVAAGEAIERAIKSGRLSDPEVSKKAYAKKREN